MVNNPLSSLFFDCTRSLNGKKFSTTNANFARKNFIETEFSHANDAKKAWLACQDCYYEDNPSGIDSANERAEDVKECKKIVSASSEYRLLGENVCDFLLCDKHLIIGVTKYLSRRRSHYDFVIMSEHRDNHYQVQVTEANLYVRKMSIRFFAIHV